MRLLLIVRRFGLTGGMERYVWELSRVLAEAGQQVTVLCEALCADAPPAGVICYPLGVVAKKPRWLAHLRFSARVDRWLADHPGDWLIHSHERCGCHQITTFHGPPFAEVDLKPWWQKLSLRIWANLWLERRELAAPSVRAIVPNSALIAEMLRRFYPQVASKIVAPIIPAVASGLPQQHARADERGGVVGFLGTEWKRKGLSKAVAIVAELRKRRPNLLFRVAGPQPEEIRHLFAGWQGGYELLGPTTPQSFFAPIDLLLHPAEREPFGMVIAEALACRIPVVVSEMCGAAELVATSPLTLLGSETGAVLPLSAPNSAWADACHRLMSCGPNEAAYQRNWSEVAREQMGVYEKIE